MGNELRVAFVCLGILGVGLFLGSCATGRAPVKEKTKLPPSFLSTAMSVSGTEFFRTNNCQQPVSYLQLMTLEGRPQRNWDTNRHDVAWVTDGPSTTCWRRERVLKAGNVQDDSGWFPLPCAGQVDRADRLTFSGPQMSLVAAYVVDEDRSWFAMTDYQATWCQGSAWLGGMVWAVVRLGPGPERVVDGCIYSATANALTLLGLRSDARSECVYSGFKH